MSSHCGIVFETGAVTASKLPSLLISFLWISTIDGVISCPSSCSETDF